MSRCIYAPLVATFLFVFCLSSHGKILARESSKPTQQDDQDDDPKVIVEVGASTSWNTTGGAATFSPNLAAETTPIENWLELEAGVSLFFTRVPLSGMRIFSSKSLGPYP